MLKCGCPWELYAMCHLLNLVNWGEVGWYLQKADLSKNLPIDKPFVSVQQVIYWTECSFRKKKPNMFFFSSILFTVFVPDCLIALIFLLTCLKCFPVPVCPTFEYWSFLSSFCSLFPWGFLPPLCLILSSQWKHLSVGSLVIHFLICHHIHRALKVGTDIRNKSVSLFHFLWFL